MGFWEDAWEATKRGTKTLLDPMDLTGIGPAPYGGLDEDPEATSNVPDPDRANFNLPGADQRGQYASGQMQGAQGRNAPQAQAYTGTAAYSNAGGAFRNDQMGALDRLRRQMSGEESLSRGQFQQATNANIAQQRSLAASANPNNAAMMARIASQNVGRMNQGFGQQAAQLGIQERNAAANALGAIAGQGRGQDMQQGQFNASQRQQNSQFNAGQRQQGSQFNVGAQLNQQGMNDQYGLGMGRLDLDNAAGQQAGSMGYEQNNTTRYGIDKGVPATPGKLERVGGMFAAAAPFMSDERAKTNVANGSGAADGLLDRLAASIAPTTYSYKDQSNGAGPRLGVLAQDVERGGPAGRDLVSEHGGAKMMDMPKSVGTALGLIGRLGERIEQLEARTKQTARKAPKKRTA